MAWLAPQCQQIALEDEAQHNSVVMSCEMMALIHPDGELQRSGIASLVSG